MLEFADSPSKAACHNISILIKCSSQGCPWQNLGGGIYRQTQFVAVASFGGNIPRPNFLAKLWAKLYGEIPRRKFVPLSRRDCAATFSAKLSEKNILEILQNRCSNFPHKTRRESSGGTSNPDPEQATPEHPTSRFPNYRAYKFMFLGSWACGHQAFSGAFSHSQRTNMQIRLFQAKSGTSRRNQTLSGIFRGIILHHLP